MRDEVRRDTQPVSILTLSPNFNVGVSEMQQNKTKKNKQTNPEAFKH